MPIVSGILQLLGSVAGVAAPLAMQGVNPLDAYKVKLEAARLEAERQRQQQELVKKGAIVLGVGVAGFFVYKIATKKKKRRRRR